MNIKVKTVLLITALICLPLTAYTSMLITAFKHNAGPVEAQAYERSRSFDLEKQALKRFKDYGLVLHCALEPKICTVHIQGADQGINGSVYFMRPNDAQQDFAQTWSAVNTVVQMPLHGRWYVEFVGEFKGEAVRARKEVYVP